MKNVNVLVTGSGSLYGVAIIRSLVNGPLNCQVIAADTDPMTLGLYFAHRRYLVPRAANTAAWLKKIVEICRREKVHGIFTGSSHETEAYAKYREQITQLTGAKVFVHQPEVIATCLDKWQTVVFLKNNGFYYPKTMRWPDDADRLTAFIEKTGFPLIAKPRLGAGSQGLAVLHGWDDLKKFIKDKQKYLLQEYLPAADGEFTVGVCVGGNKKILSSVALKRSLRDGMTMAAVADDYHDICRYCERVAKAINAYGPINMQLRLKRGNPYIFEINPRFSSSTGMRIALGVNEAELLIRSELLGEEVAKPKVKKAGVIRQYYDYVIPLKDIRKVRGQV